MPLPNRLATYATAAGALALGLTPLVGNLDWESTAGILGAIVAVTGVVAVWLRGWRNTNAAKATCVMPGDETLDDDFDETTAEPIPRRRDAAQGGTTYTPADPAESQRDNPPGFASRRPRRSELHRRPAHPNARTNGNGPPPPQYVDEPATPTDRGLVLAAIAGGLTILTLAIWKAAELAAHVSTPHSGA